MHTQSLRALYLLYLILLFSNINSQCDSLYFHNRKVACKINEIKKESISYTLCNYSLSPVFNAAIKSVRGYKIAGSEAYINLKDSQSVVSKTILARNALALKVNPGGLLNNYLSLAVEQNINSVIALECEGGYVTSLIPWHTSYANQSLLQFDRSPANYNGGYLRPSIKWRYLNTISFKRTNVFYTRVDFIMNYLKYYNVVMYYASGSNNVQLTASHVMISSQAALLNFGQQITWRSGILLDFFVGVGYSSLAVDFSKKEMMEVDQKKIYNEYVVNKTQNLYSYRRVSTTGLSYAAGIRIGYYLKDWE